MLGLGLVSKVVFGAFFESSLLITLESHVGHTKFPDLYFILDKNPFVRLRRLVNTIHTAVVLRCASIIYQQRLRTTITK